MRYEVTQLLRLAPLAQKLRLPATWLRDEAQAGRVPCLFVGKRFLFNEKAVIAALLQRAASERAGDPR
ncbi:MAG: hypothetical protein V3W41_18290 [Planctomycetota bacterium]